VNGAQNAFENALLDGIMNGILKISKMPNKKTLEGLGDY
jgi:hypothetical protein